MSVLNLHIVHSRVVCLLHVSLKADKLSLELGEPVIRIGPVLKKEASMFLSHSSGIAYLNGAWRAAKKVQN